MIVYILVVLALAIVIGCILPTQKANLKNSPRCPKPNNTDIKYHLTLRYVEDIPYCDEIESDIDTDEEWLYD